MQHRRTLTVWMIALINVCAVTNIKNFPVMAEYGLATLFFLALASLVFFIPVSLIASELASGWPERGVYSWVKEGLGPRLGFMAIWLQWVENVFYYPTLLTFIAATFAYIVNPDLAMNKLYVFFTIITLFWAVTLINFLGIRVSGWISSITALFGTILPIVLIILLGLFWISGGNTTQIQFTWKGLWPDLTSINQLVLFTGVLFGLCGMEMPAVHATDVKNPRRDYPRAIFLSAALIIVLSAFGSIVIAAVVPAKEIQLASGGMAAFRALFFQFGMPWAVPIVAAITIFGALGMLSTWVVGPSRGLHATAEHGDLPPILQKTNKHEMPVAILIAQALIVTALSFLFLFMPSVSSTYWIFIVLASELYMVMYILMFIAAIRLRYTHPHVPRAYQIPFGNIGIWVVSCLGILGSSFAIFVGLFPPSQLETGNLFLYESFLFGGLFLFCLLPILIFNARKPEWRRNK